MSRPADWSPLGYASDPVPGDPLIVAGAAQTFQGIAEEISKAESHLRNISINGQGEAIHKIRQKCDELADKIKKAHTICDGADDALNPYVEVLESVQETSLKELENARVHKAEGKNAYQDRELVREQYNASQDPQQRNELRNEFMRHDARLRHEMAEVDAARRRLQNAIDERNVAAETAARNLRGLVSESGLKDSWWDKICGIARKVSEWLEKIKPWLDKISAILSVVSIVVACIPGLQVVAAVLKIVSLALAAATLATGVMVNGRKLIDGEMGWGEFLLNTGMDVLGLVGATKAAKGAMGVLKGSRTGVTAAAQHVKDTASWAKRANELKGAKPVKRLYGRAKDLWNGEPLKRRVLDAYGYHLWRNGADGTVGSGIKYAILREGTKDVYKGTRNLIKDKVIEPYTGTDKQKAPWEYYFPGKIKKALKPVP
ncbi:putative T7SS-secreted protein [Actinomyces trachealis]|uniref:putative T7SS-secreted protein n=1 Tax=Actinomyces trachealis TaxID=2763540 RepID=UPI001892C395|nr:hypothetical protein [Actinomyces trachealis]